MVRNVGLRQPSRVGASLESRFVVTDVRSCECQFTRTGVGVEKGLVVDFAGKPHVRAVGGVLVGRLSGGRCRPSCWGAQEADQPFDVLGGGSQEELLLNELQPAQAEAV